jgi:hypothetical protein
MVVKSSYGTMMRDSNTTVIQQEQQALCPGNHHRPTLSKSM